MRLRAIDPITILIVACAVALILAAAMNEQ